MKAAVYYGKHQIAIEEKDLREIKEDEVLVRNRAAGVCGTDVHIFNGEKGASEVSPPVILGHEYAGEIVKIGTGVRELQIGDHITIDPNIYCGICDACRNGKKQMCDHMQAVGVNFDGGFAEYSIVPAKQCIKVSPDLSFEAAAMSEPLACCIHGIDRAGIKAGQSVCIIGGGAIGLLMVQLARLQGASTVIMSEPVEMRRRVGLKLGADVVIDPTQENMLNQIYRATGKKGVDVVIECVGIPAAARQAFEVAGRGATIVLFSVPSPDVMLEVRQFDIFSKELDIRGAFVNPDTHLRAVNLLNNKRINTEEIITNRYPIERTEEAIRKQTEKDSIKVLVTM